MDDVMDTDGYRPDTQQIGHPAEASTDQRRLAELETLHHLSLQLNSQMDTGALLQLIVDQAVALMGVEAGLLFLYDPAGDQLYAEIATDYLAEFIGVRLNRSEGLAWHAFESRRAQSVTNYPTWSGRVAIQAQRPLLSNLLATPLVGRNGVLGVLDLGSERRAFGDHDIWLAELFAAQATVALESAHLIDEVQRQTRENARLLDAERRQLRHLQESQAQMVRVEKMAALGRMAAALAHEINNPLQAIQSHIELVMDFPLSPEQRTEFLGVVRSEMGRLTGIVQRVLDFARPTLSPRRSVAVNELVRQSLALADKQRQRQHIRVMTAVEDGLIVSVGADQIVQVLLNLVINAIEAIGRDGEIEIRALRDGDYARLTIYNDGPPIAKDDLPHIFEPFYTTKSDGTGLGLAVSKNLIEQYDGHIAVTNRPDGSGVLVTVQLPLAAPGMIEK